MDSQADKDSCSIDLSPLSSSHRHNNNLTLLQVLHRAIHHRHPRCPRASLPSHSRGAAAERGAGSRRDFECHERRLEVAGNRGRLCLCRRARPLVPCLSLCLIYMASSVPVPSRDESSPLPEPPRADEAGCISPLALESSPAPPLEAIDPARLFVNREGGSPPRPRLKGMRTWLFTRLVKDGCQRGEAELSLGNKLKKLRGESLRDVNVIDLEAKGNLKGAWCRDTQHTRKCRPTATRQSRWMRLAVLNFASCQN